MKRVGWLQTAAAVAVVALTLAIRVRGVERHFWLLGDQIRDWSMALGSFGTLPLVGPPTHVHGYTIGPAFYWILWAMRVVLGPWFQNLPHAGGIGHAVLQSAADGLLVVAVRRRAASPWIGLVTVVLLASAPFDLCLSALVWNPVMGAALAKTAIAPVLLNWPNRSAAGVSVTAATAWAAVHAYTGAVFVAVGVVGALLVSPLARGSRRELWRNLAIVTVVVALLQTPYLVHRVINRSDQAMGAVTGGVALVLSGRERPQFAKSQAGYAAAFDFIEAAPWHIPLAGWVLTACGVILALRRRRDLQLLSLTLVPQVTAIAGYALFLGALDHYYYLSLMPASLITVLMALSPPPSSRFAKVLGPVLLAGVLAIVPARLRVAETMHRMPEYGALVDGSRKLASLRQPMRAIRTEFTLPPTSDPEFLYTVLGGRIDRQAPWVGVVRPDGHVLFREISRER